ncbi:MAG: hypothetical protein ACRDM7_09405 [Thermoleophilaceae bacterium]
MWAHIQEEPASLPGRRGLDPVLRKALAKDKEQRHASCAALIEGAADALGVAWPRSPAPVPEFRAKAASVLDRRMRAVALAALLAAVGGVVVFAVSRIGETRGSDRIDSDAVGLIDPSDGSLTSQYTLGGSPGALAEGAGSVWVANSGTGTVARIDRGAEQVTAIDTGGQPTALAYGAGSLWVAEGETHRLVQVNPRTNRVASRFRVGNAPSGVAVGSGAVWVTAPIDGRIDRIDLSEGGRVRRIDLGGRPVALAAGATGVWAVAEEGEWRPGSSPARGRS